MPGWKTRTYLATTLPKSRGAPSKCLRLAADAVSHSLETVPEVIDYFESEAAENGTAIAIMGDDGEKFGSWPGTYEWCYEKGWMEDFFTAIEQNSDWLEMITPGEYANRFPPLGRIYLPTASYAEMMEWSLPANVSTEFVEIEHEMEQQDRQDVLRFLRGGFWRNFMVKSRK